MTADAPDGPVPARTPEPALPHQGGGAIAPAAIVPPFLGKDWQTLRGFLMSACDHAALAAEHSTTEAVRPEIGKAQIALMDAVFWLETIQRRR